MRKITAVMVLLLIVFSFPATLAANPGEIKVFVDREEVVFTVPPVFVNDHLLVPMRTMLRALGAEISSWDSEAGTVTARQGESTVIIKIREPFAWVNGKAVELDAPPTIINGCTMVPLRLFSEFLGLQVRWNAEQETVEIESSDFIPFDRPVQDTEKLPPRLREWVESSWDELNIQAKKVEGKMYILTTYGLKPSGGYRVEIKKIERTRDAIKIVVEFTEPSREFYTIEVFNRPYDLVSLDPAELEDSRYLICFTRGLEEGELPVRLEVKP